MPLPPTTGTGVGPAEEPPPAPKETGEGAVEGTAGAVLEPPTLGAGANVLGPACAMATGEGAGLGVAGPPKGDGRAVGMGAATPGCATGVGAGVGEGVGLGRAVGVRAGIGVGVGVGIGVGRRVGVGVGLAIGVGVGVGVGVGAGVGRSVGVGAGVGRGVGWAGLGDSAEALLGALGAGDGGVISLVGSCLPADSEAFTARRRETIFFCVGGCSWMNSMSVICDLGGGGTIKKNARMKQESISAKWNRYEPLVASGISMTYSGYI